MRHVGKTSSRRELYEFVILQMFEIVQVAFLWHQKYAYS